MNEFDRRGLEIVNYGADMTFKTDIAAMDK